MTMMPHSRWSGLRAMPHGYGFAVRRSQNERPSSVASCLSWYNGDDTVKRKSLHTAHSAQSETAQTDDTNAVDFQCQTDHDNNNYHETGFNISSVQRVSSSYGHFRDARQSKMNAGAADHHKCQSNYSESIKRDAENSTISKSKLTSPRPSFSPVNASDANVVNNPDHRKECSGCEVDSRRDSEEKKNQKDSGSRRYAVSYRQPYRKPRRVELRRDGTTPALCHQSNCANNCEHFDKDNTYSANDRENEDNKGEKTPYRGNFSIHQANRSSKGVTNITGNKVVQFNNRRSEAFCNKSISASNDVDWACRCDICNNNNNNNTIACRSVKNCWNVQSCCDVVRNNDLSNCCEFNSCMTGAHHHNSHNKHQRYRPTHGCTGKCGHDDADEDDFKKAKNAVVLEKTHTGLRPATADGSVVPYRNQQRDNRTNGQRTFKKSIYYNNPRVVYNTNLCVSDEDDASSVDVQFTTKLSITNRQSERKKNAIINRKDTGTNTVQCGTEGDEHHDSLQDSRGSQDNAGSRHTKEFTYQTTSGNKWTPSDTQKKLSQNSRSLLTKQNPSKDEATYQSGGTSSIVENSPIQGAALSAPNISGSCHVSVPRGTSSNCMSKTNNAELHSTLANKTDDVIEQILQSEDAFKRIVEYAATVRQQRASSAAAGGRRQKYSRMPVNTYGENWSKGTPQRTGSSRGVNGEEIIMSHNHDGRQSCDVKDISPRRVMTPHHVNLFLDVVPARVHGSRPIHLSRYN